jgi:vacuolar protein sorting-associated protein 26
MQALFSALVGPACVIQIRLDGTLGRATKRIVYEGGGFEDLLIYNGADGVSGDVTISPRRGGAMDHAGIKIELLGQIEMLFESGGSPFLFTSLISELASPGSLNAVTSYPFAFPGTDKMYESYNGMNVRLRYIVRVTVSRHLPNLPVTADKDIWVINTSPPALEHNKIRTEVGIADCLHIDVEWNKDKYHLREVIMGKVSFLKVRIKIKSMEIALLRREKAGSGAGDSVGSGSGAGSGVALKPGGGSIDSETIGKIEVMDGCPVRDEAIQIRIFLSQFDNITPTYTNVNNQFSTRYSLNIVIIDESGRRYFKQQEITLYRRHE